MLRNLILTLPYLVTLSGKNPFNLHQSRHEAFDCKLMVENKITNRGGEHIYQQTKTCVCRFFDDTHYVEFVLILRIATISTTWATT